MKKILGSRWYILGLTLAANFLLVGVCRLCMPVLFKEIGSDLNFDLVAMGAVWGIDPLGGLFISLPSGLIVDRFGVKRTLFIMCFLSAIFGALRGFSVNFIMLAASTLVFGLAASTITTVGTKVTAIWFKGHYLKLTNALIFTFMYLGQMAGSMLSATVFSPLLGGWRNVLFVYSVPVLITSFLFLAFSGKAQKDPAGTVPNEKYDMIGGLKQVLRLPTVWVMGIALFAQVGSVIAINGYTPIYLRGLGWDTLGASSALTLMLGGAFLGTLPVMFTTTRFMSARSMVIGSMVLGSICNALIPFFGSTGVLILSAVSGFLRAAPAVLLAVLVIEAKGVGPERAGTAIGFIYTLGMLGAFAFPPLGNSFASINPGLPFIFWSALCLISLIGFLFLKKTQPIPA
jgi:MFS family permease